MFDFDKAFKELDEDTDHIKVYVSGPISNDKEHYDENFKKAKKVIEEKTVEGAHMYRAVNPLDFEVDYKDEEKWTTSTWLKCIIKDLEILGHCDMMVVMPNWEVSAGCVSEVIAARKLGLHIMSLHEPFGVMPDAPEGDISFPTYRAREMWRKICEFQNTASSKAAYDILDKKIQAIASRLIGGTLTSDDILSYYWTIESADSDTGLSYCSVDEGNFYDWVSKEAATKFVDCKKALKAYYDAIDKYKSKSIFIKKHEVRDEDRKYYIRFDNVHDNSYPDIDYRYLSKWYYDGADYSFNYYYDTSLALKLTDFQAESILKELNSMKKAYDYDWTANIVEKAIVEDIEKSKKGRYGIRYWDDKEHQWMYLEQSKCSYKIGMFNFDRDKAERFTYQDANKEVLRIRNYNKKFGGQLHIVDVTDNTEGCLDCPPIAANVEKVETESEFDDRKYAIRYWDEKEGKWKYYRFGGGFGDKEGCQTYTYTDAKKVLAFSTTRQELEIVDTTIEDTCESEYLKEKDKLDRLAGDAKNYNKQKKLVDKLHKQMAEKEEASDGFIILSYNRDRSCKRYLSLFDKANKSYKFSVFIKEAIVFPSRAKALKAYHAVKKIKDNDSKAWISKLDVLTVARKSDVLKWNHYEEGKIGNYVLAYFGPDSKLRYIRSVRNKSCWATEDIKEAESFTKVGAIQALEKILQADMVNFKNVQIEPFIVNLSKKEEE